MHREDLERLLEPAEVVFAQGDFHGENDQNGWFMRKKTTKMDDAGVALFQETSILIDPLDPLVIQTENLDLKLDQKLDLSVSIYELQRI